MKRILILIQALLALCLAAYATAANVPATVTKVCANCHGADGNSESPMFPRLAGQEPDYLQRQLLAYRDQTRANPAAQNYMWGMAKLLTDDDIKQVANWFAAQAPVYDKQPGAGDDRGRMADAIFRQGLPDQGVPACATCHGDRAQGTSIAPRLAGQHAHYIESQLKVLATGERPAAVMMQPIAQKLNEEQVAALAAYLGKL
ncbi:MAG: cytochrome c4 [Burkholderiales bacterium]|nr:cytochrome c4 [Burkholderiales bacterium]